MNNMALIDPTNPPPPLLTSEAGSFAETTITTRKPKIIEQVLADHEGQYPPEIVQALETLHAEIIDRRPVQPLTCSFAEADAWQTVWQAHKGKHWFDLPWFFAEAFFYHRLLEATGYFGSDIETVASWQGVDPFLPQKQAELAAPAPWQVLNLALERSDDNTDLSFNAMLHHTVWGNRVDLSYTQVAQDAGRDIVLEEEQENLLVDDTAAAMAHVHQTILRRGSSPRQVDFICDNSGTELLLDLALADYFLCFGSFGQVTLHVKTYPYFVSDATPDDVEATVAAIAARTGQEKVQELSQRLNRYRREERLVIRSDPFWNSSQFFWELPEQLRTNLAQSRLVVVKGDANYRRLLGDSRWPTTTDLGEITAYFPAPYLALRTLKSDPIVGLRPGQAEELDQADSHWRVNGKRGVIQFVS
jgi:uncharacterized protein with ATP-grasp and redox domains